MSMFGKDAPAAPDYTGAAEAQGAASQQSVNQQMYANRPNQYSTFGATTWTPEQIQDPSTGEYYTTFNQHTQLAEPLQDAATSQMNIARDRSRMGEALLGRAQENLQQGIDWGAMPQAGGSIQASPLQRSVNLQGAPSMPGSLDSPDAMNQRGMDAVYSQYTSRLDPQWSQREEATRSQLMNQGLRPGDEAYDTAMANLSRERNDAYQGALNQSVLQGAQIGGQLFNQGLASGQFDLARNRAGTSDLFQQAAFQNQAAGQDLNMQQQESAYQNQLRQQQIAEEMQRQGWDLNFINAALAGQQVGMPSMPGFQGAGQAQAPNYLGAAQAQYGAGMDAYNAQQMNQQGLMNGLLNFGLMF